MNGREDSIEERAGLDQSNQEPVSSKGVPRLYNPAELRAIFPEPRPSIRRLKSLARRTGHCVVIGRTVAFTEENIDALLEELRPVRPASRASRHDRPGSSYARALALLSSSERKRKQT
jgi:hypothetical protein